VVEESLRRAGCDWDDLDAIAVTRGPGLAPALLVGLNVAKGLSFARGLPLIGVNHLEGHVYANWITWDGVRFGRKTPAPFAPTEGVAANARRRERLLAESPVSVLIPPIWLCTDNAAMIAAAGYQRMRAGERADVTLDILPVWPIA